MGRIGMAEIIFTALIIILLFGVRKLPEIGSSIGKAIREFKRAFKEDDHPAQNNSDDQKK